MCGNKTQQNFYSKKKYLMSPLPLDKERNQEKESECVIF